MHLLTEALKVQRIGTSRRRFANLDSLPDTPATNILNFRGGEILDFVPFKYRHTNFFTQIVDVKHIAEEDISSVATNVRRSKRADDWYSFGQRSKVNEVSLGLLSKPEANGERGNPRMS
jgi:hypothetical protein